MKFLSQLKGQLFPLVLLLFLSVSVISCSKSNGPNLSVKKFAGNWAGKYTGNKDRGSWSVKIDEDGDVNGIAISTVYSQSYILVGTVNSAGQISFSVGGVSTGASFSGVLNDDKSALGTWTNKSISPEDGGSWSGDKQ